MALKDLEASINVYEAAKKRIQNVFDSGVEVALSISGGKDSICLASLVYELLEEGKINPDQLVVQFIDEEAMFDDVIDMVKYWRKKFLLKGVPFDWYCVEVYHYNCLNSLEDDEKFILWDRHKEEDWVRPMPKFAKTSHPLLRERQDTYQDFLKRINQGRISIIGVRAAESVQRRINLANLNSGDKGHNGVTAEGLAYPIYDWKDSDVWYHIEDKGLKFPRTYIHLYQVGMPLRRLRISQFFSIYTAPYLNKLDEFDHGLMERVVKREPNAYLTSMYWDTELFGKSKKRKSKPTSKEGGDEEEEDIDYRKRTFEVLKEAYRYQSKTMKQTRREIRKIIGRHGAILEEKDFKTIHDILVAGDPKYRKIRGLLKNIHYRYAQDVKKEAKND